MTGLFPACGTSRRLFLSMPGSCWLCFSVSSTSSPFCQGPQWPCFAAISPWSPIYSGGGDWSPALDTVAQRFLRWAVSLRIRLAPLFLPGIRNVLADSLPSSPATLFRMVSQHGRISIFAASVAGDVRPVCHFRPSPLLHLFSPYRDPLSAGTDALLQSWDGLLACAFPPWSVLPGCWRSLGCLTGPSSPSTGLSVLGSWPSSSCRWLLQCLFQCAQTSSSSLGLVAATWVSTGWPFMPGDCPAPHQGGWFLLGGGCAGFVGAPSIIALHLPAQVVGLPVMVPLSGLLHLAAIPLQGSGFPLVASIGSGP